MSLGSTGRGIGILRRNYTGKKPVVIQHRSQDAVSYYDHENVNTKRIFIRKYQIFIINRIFILVHFQGAKIIKSSHFELDYTLGRKITFFCMAQGKY